MSDTAASRVYFSESQRFRQRWLWALLVGSLLFVVGLLYVEGVTGTEAAVSAAVPVGVLVLFAVARLRTEVREDGIRVQFCPFHLSERRISFDEIERAEAVEYGPLGDYGGWGIRWGPKGWAYNVSGREGVRVHRPDAKPLLIGSQRADELQSAIERASR